MDDRLFSLLASLIYFIIKFSDGWTTEDLIFKWKKADPVQVTSDLHLPRFALEQFTTDYCDSQTNTGEFIIFLYPTL